jgi:hypothetical protein
MLLMTFRTDLYSWNVELDLDTGVRKLGHPSVVRGIPISTLEH